MKVEIELQDLTTQGLDQLLQDLSGEPGPWLDDWSRIGPLIEQERIELAYTRKNAVHEILARSSAKFSGEPWTATIDNAGEVTIETGPTALQAVARVFVSAFPKDDGQMVMELSAETVTTHLKDVGPVVYALMMGSDEHEVEQVDGSWMVFPVDDARLDEFQGVARIVDALDRRGLKKLASKTSEADPLKIAEVTFQVEKVGEVSP